MLFRSVRIEGWLVRPWSCSWSCLLCIISFLHILPSFTPTRPREPNRSRLQSLCAGVARIVSPISHTSNCSFVSPRASHALRRRFGGSVICEGRRVSYAAAARCPSRTSSLVKIHVPCIEGFVSITRTRGSGAREQRRLTQCIPTDLRLLTSIAISTASSGEA